VAMLFVRSPADDRGMISWMCSQGGVLPGVRLGGTATDGTQRVVWRFDADRPDTVDLEALTGSSTWFVPRDRIASFTTRAKTASRLVIRVIGGPRAADYTYDLTGSTVALDRLACARTPRPPQGPPGANTSSSTPKERPREDAEGTYELSLVEERPSPINTRDLLRALERNYPPLLRDARMTGTVQVRFRVMADGSVDTTSISVVSSSHEEFNLPTINSVGVLRFRPAKVNGRPVRAWVVLPIQWTVMGPPPPADSAAARPRP
jgi:TonB family protein